VEQKESIMRTELKRCTIIERRWNNSEVSRGSPDKELNRLIIIIIILVRQMGVGFPEENVQGQYRRFCFRSHVVRRVTHPTVSEHCRKLKPAALSSPDPARISRA